MFSEHIEGLRDVFLFAAEELYAKGPVIRRGHQHFARSLVPVTDSPHVDHFGKRERGAKGPVDQSERQVAHTGHRRQHDGIRKLNISYLQHALFYRLVVEESNCRSVRLRPYNPLTIDLPI